MSLSGKASIFFGFFLIMFADVLYAADTPMLERTVTISLRQERMDAALKKIAEQGGFIFSRNEMGC